MVELFYTCNNGDNSDKEHKDLQNNACGFRNNS